MAVFIPAFSTTLNLAGGTFNSGFVVTNRSSAVGATISSDTDLTFKFHWSNDGISSVLIESETVTGGTATNFFSPIKAQYLEIELIDLGINTSLAMQGFFY